MNEKPEPSSIYSFLAQLVYRKNVQLLLFKANGHVSPNLNCWLIIILKRV
jgi:hypothetical protein